MLAEYRLREDVDVHADANTDSPLLAQFKFGDIITVKRGASGNRRWDGGAGRSGSGLLDKSWHRQNPSW